MWLILKNVKAALPRIFLPSIGVKLQLMLICYRYFQTHKHLCGMFIFFPQRTWQRAEV